MNYVTLLLLLCAQLILTACSPIKIPASNQYTLDAVSAQDLVKSKTITKHKTNTSILVSLPEGLAGYQTDQMHYVQKPFELDTFVHNSWVSSPANMLYPLITQSLQKTGYFHAVASGPYVDKANYRLDTQIITLHQNFLVKPSVMELVVKVMLTHIEDLRVVSSLVISEHVSCPTDTPYGGVIAANKAAQRFTKHLSAFVIAKVEQDKANLRRVASQ